MSHDWGYGCITHDPPLESEHWLNHGADTLRRVFRVVRAGSWPQTEPWPGADYTDPMPVEHHGYQHTGVVPWLLAHPRCEVVVVDEYGVAEPIDADREVCGAYRVRDTAAPRCTYEPGHDDASHSWDTREVWSPDRGWRPANQRRVEAL